MMPSEIKVPHAVARRAVRLLLSQTGIETSHAEYVAETLVSTTLKGIDTHGLELLPTYIDEITSGRCKTKPNIVVSRRNISTTLVDADHALGIVGANIGMRTAIADAKLHGISTSVVRNSNHFGAAGFYSELAAKGDLIGFALSNSDALVAPFNGTAPVSGTNPLAMAAPADGELFSLDMATSQVSFSLVRSFLGSGQRLGLGWAIDADARDSSESGSFSALKPLGGYKGQGLALMVQILTALLATMPFDHQLSHLYGSEGSSGRTISHMFICLRIDHFTTADEFRKRLSELLTFHRRSPSVSGQRIITPGELERRTAATRLTDGLPLSSRLHTILEPYLTHD